MEKKTIFIILLLIVVGFIFVRGQETIPESTRYTVLEDNDNKEPIEKEFYFIESEFEDQDAYKKYIHKTEEDYDEVLIKSNSHPKKYYYYKYIPYLREYQKIYCYKSPPEGKLFYAKCPDF